MATTAALSVSAGWVAAAVECASCRDSQRQTSGAALQWQNLAGTSSSYGGQQVLQPRRQLGYVPQRRSVGPISAVVAAEREINTLNYTNPTWSQFEMGRAPVYWETATGRAPESGAELTIFFNPSATTLNPVPGYGVGFNGGFNSPIMCGGAPRGMVKRERGSNCEPFYSIRVLVPVHAITLEFSFTDGQEWHGPYKLEFEIPARFRNQPKSFFNKALAEELSGDGCERAIFPDKVQILDRCIMPAGITHEGGDRCSLDIIPGCMDPASPEYDPYATFDDGSCPIDF